MLASHFQDQTQRSLLFLTLHAVNEQHIFPKRGTKPKRYIFFFFPCTPEKTYGTFGENYDQREIELG